MIPLQAINDFRLPFSLALGLLAGVFLFSACKKGEPEPNLPPETFTSLEEINLSGENRLNSLVRLNWWGTDPDGVLKGYELSFDQEHWFFTENQDSTFLFSINAGSDTIDIDFYVRAVDMEGARDQSPAYLRIPLRNTPPEVTFISELLPADTAFIVLTALWEANDLDGIQTIEGIELKFNNSDWITISPIHKQVSFIGIDPKNEGETSARVLDLDGDEIATIEGMKLNDLNDLYVRVVDIAGSYSKEDTAAGIYIRNQGEDVLVVGAHASSPNAFYRSNLNQAGVSFDFIDFVREDAKNQPRVWSPTMGLIMGNYETVVIYANDVNFTNAQTNAESIVLEYASTSIQQFVDKGGKLLISSSFPNGFSTGSALFGILPIDSFSTSVGQARLPIDSTIYSSISGFPTMRCNSFISGLDPFYPASDAETMYRANLTTSNGWVGPDIVGARRRMNGETNFIFLSVELHRLNGDPNAASAFFDQVFNHEFDW